MKHSVFKKRVTLMMKTFLIHFLGQFVVVVPQYDLIIVRLGRKNLRNKNNPDLPTKPFEIYVSEVLKYFI